MSTQTEQEQVPLDQLQPEHRWLEKLAGKWTYEGEAEGEEGKATGKETVRSLGGLWILAEGEGEMPGSPEPMRTLMSLGYNPQTRRYVGTWIGSMMTHMWVYDGEMDATGKVLTLNCEGPSMADHTVMAPYRDVLEIIDDDHRILRAFVQEDGQWRHFMTTNYRRVK